jgi:hypothetical protein
VVVPLIHLASSRTTARMRRRPTEAQNPMEPLEEIGRSLAATM